MDTQTKLKALTDDLKALKANYPVAASLVKFYVVTSQTFTVSGQDSVTIKFTPTQISGKNVLVELRAKATISGNPVGFEAFVNLPQDGSGEVKLRMDFESPSSTHNVVVFASGTTPGTFSMV